MKQLIDNMLNTHNAKLYVIMGEGLQTTVSIERDIDTLEQFDNVFELFNVLLNKLTQIGKKGYIVLDDAKYPLALAKTIKLTKGLSFYVMVV